MIVLTLMAAICSNKWRYSGGRLQTTGELPGVLVATLIAGDSVHGGAGECPKWDPTDQVDFLVPAVRSPVVYSGGATKRGGGVLRPTWHFYVSTTFRARKRVREQLLGTRIIPE